MTLSDYHAVQDNSTTPVYTTTMCIYLSRLGLKVDGEAQRVSSCMSTHTHTSETTYERGFCHKMCGWLDIAQSLHTLPETHDTLSLH